MIKHDKFIFIHFPKAGGMSITRSLRFRDNCDGITNHYGICNLTDEERNRDLIGILRDPLDWYVSYYYFFRNVLIGKNSNKMMGAHLFQDKPKIDLHDLKASEKDMNECFCEMIDRKSEHFVDVLIDNKVTNKCLGYDIYSNMVFSMFTHNYKFPENLTIYDFTNIDMAFKEIQTKYGLKILELQKHNISRYTKGELYPETKKLIQQNIFNFRGL